MHTRYVALLRGINVGGGNIIRMADLKACLEAAGLREVSTYIQSGNALFTAAAADPARLRAKIERALSAAFRPYEARIVLRTHAALRATVRGAPAGFGAAPDQFRYDVAYVREPLEAAEALRHVPLREGVDTAAAGPGALYFTKRIAKAGQSRLPRLVSSPIYADVTIRNWNTTRKLLALLDAAVP